MVDLVIEAKRENLGQVLAFAEEELIKGGCSLEFMIQTLIAVEEIFINIACYAYKAGTGTALIRIDVKEEIIVEFQDSGTPYNPLATSPPDIESDLMERKIGGLGVFMVKKYMDDMEYRYENNKNILVLKKSLC